jgi:hypothetical protein
MGKHFLAAATGAAALLFAPTSWAQGRNVSYPEIKVNVSEPFRPDPAFDRMRQTLVRVAANKDLEGLLKLVGPTFAWSRNGGPIETFNMGRDATHNFKVAFGFRALDKEVDGGVENGPFWDALAAFAADTSYFEVGNVGNLVCGPLAPDITDFPALERALARVGPAYPEAEWYFTTTETAVARAPGDAGPPIARIGKIALPVLGAHPQAAAGQPEPPATHLQVLLPAGKTGWIPAAAARPLMSDRLCYAKVVNGDWKIAAFDQSGE